MKRVTFIGSQPSLSLEEVKDTKNIPQKYCYIDEGAKVWNDLRSESSFTVASSEFLCLKETLKKIKKDKGVNIVHIGVGNGIEIPLLSERFQNENYFGIDISKNLLKLAKVNFKEELERFSDYDLTCCDIESKKNIEQLISHVKSKSYLPSIFIFPGEGTLLSNAIILSSLSKEINQNDRIILILQKWSEEKKKEIFQIYKSTKGREHLRVGLKSIGIKKGEFLNPEYDEDKEILFVSFKSEFGNICCLKSYKPKSLESLKKRLKRSSLQVLENVETEGMIGVICGLDPNNL